MTREEYREQMRALDKEALNVINKKSILRWEYIKSNGGHKIGAKANIFGEQFNKDYLYIYFY
jgi:hypothetical protein